MPEQPPWAPTRIDPPPAGYRYEWRQERPEWAAAVEPRPCRFTVGPGHRLCRQPSVATLDRASRGRRPMLWHYCAEHLYGRAFHDGAVWSVVLVEAPGA